MRERIRTTIFVYFRPTEGLLLCYYNCFYHYLQYAICSGKKPLSFLNFKSRLGSSQFILLLLLSLLLLSVIIGPSMSN